ncbi:hypothetical protein K0A97_00535 [Patescibacteria group bacterium]|nr:hypothetical protein [Patescibacteria group bacterium]
MSFKNNVADFTTMNVHMDNAKNRVGGVICIVLSIISLLIGLISFLFNWILALVFIGVSLFFFGISKLTKVAIKANEKTIEKIQAMKDPSPNERF